MQFQRIEALSPNMRQWICVIVMGMFRILDQISPRVVTLAHQTALIPPVYFTPHPSVALKLFGSAADGKAWQREKKYY